MLEKGFRKLKFRKIWFRKNWFRKNGGGGEENGKSALGTLKSNKRPLLDFTLYPVQILLAHLQEKLN